jgi:lipoprotein NlpI
VSPKDRAALHAELGAGYYERGRMDVAIEELTEAQTLDPTNPKVYNYFGLVYTVLGDNAKAEQNFQRALQIAPLDPDVRHNWGWYLCSNDRPKESIPEFEIALRDPFYKTPEIALTNAGRCSAALRRLRQRRCPTIAVLSAATPPMRLRCTGLRWLRTAEAGTTRPAVTRGDSRSCRSPPPKRCFSGCASSERQAIGPPKRCIRRCCATATRTRSRPSPSARGCANERATRSNQLGRA